MGVDSHPVIAAPGRAKFFLPNFVKFSQSDGVSVGVRPLMLAIAHVKQSMSGAELILPRK